MEDIKYEQALLRIQLRRNFVIQLEPHGNEIVSGFSCDILITFKVIRANAVIFL
jgi:hypothetical protein